MNIAGAVCYILHSVEVIDLGHNWETGTLAEAFEHGPEWLTAGFDILAVVSGYDLELQAVAGSLSEVVGHSPERHLVVDILLVESEHGLELKMDIGILVEVPDCDLELRLEKVDIHAAESEHDLESRLAQLQLQDRTEEAFS